MEVVKWHLKFEGSSPGRGTVLIDAQRLGRKRHGMGRPFLNALARQPASPISTSVQRNSPISTFL